MFSKKMINLGWILDIGNYLSSLERWLEIYQLKQANRVEEERFLNQYIKLVKPNVHKYHTIITTISEGEYGFYSDKLQSQQIAALKDVYRGLSKFDILAAGEMKEANSSKKYQFLTFEDFKLLLKNPVTNLTRVPLNERPKNEEFQYWGENIKVDKVEIQSVVIHGKGVAKKELGFPTANLQVDQAADKALKQHPNGVYLVQFSFKKGGRYAGICCIGTNPHYQNLKYKRLIEVYIYHQFAEDFYDAQVGMKLLSLLRFEGRFETFDCFLNAMHNDIEMGKKIAEKMKLIL